MKERNFFTDSHKLVLKIFAFGILAFFVLFLILEGGANLLGFGYDVSPYVEVGNFRRINYELYNLYYPNSFSSENYTTLRNLWEKKNEKVILVLGGSTAQGFPYINAWDFPSIIGQVLNYVSPDPFRIVNYAASAQSSYTVRDLIERLHDLKPTAVIVYSGHNEYYGTISATSADYDWQRELYLFLNKSRFFRGLYKILQAKEPAEGTLMERQFHGRLFQSEEIDREVVRNFISNISRVEKLCREQNIPLIVVEPISNLIDQPPFSSGPLEEYYKNRIQAFHQAIKTSRSFQDLNQEYEYAVKNTEYYNLASVQYLLGLGLLKKEGRLYLDYFVRAKDLDCIPFRSRSSLNFALKNWAANTRRLNSNFRYIDLSQDFYLSYGPGIFSYKIFIDHLHFNFLGNYLVAKSIIEKSWRILGLDENQYKIILNIFNNSNSFRIVVPYNDVFAARAYDRISNLIIKPPFSTMVVPIDIGGINPFPDHTAHQERLQSYSGVLESSPVRSPFDVDLFLLRYLSDQLLSERNIFTLYEAFLYFVRSYPSHPVSWLNLSVWHDSWGRPELVPNYLAMTYGLAKALDFDFQLPQIRNLMLKYSLDESELMKLFLNIEKIPMIPSLLEVRSAFNGSNSIEE